MCALEEWWSPQSSGNHHSCDSDYEFESESGVGAAAIGRYGISVIVGCVAGFMPYVVV
jgi:hypothetical protein